MSMLINNSLVNAAASALAPNDLLSNLGSGVGNGLLMGTTVCAVFWVNSPKRLTTSELASIMVLSAAVGSVWAGYGFIVGTAIASTALVSIDKSKPLRTYIPAAIVNSAVACVVATTVVSIATATLQGLDFSGLNSHVVFHV